MTIYELMVITGTDGTADKIEKFLKDINAENVKTEEMGTKQLAYPIAKLTEADYFLYRFEAPSEGISELMSRLRLEQEAVLRYLLTKFNPKSEKARIMPTVSEKPKPTATAKVTVSTTVTAKPVKAEVKKEEKKVVKVAKVTKAVKEKKPVKKTSSKAKKK